PSYRPQLPTLPTRARRGALHPAAQDNAGFRPLAAPHDPSFGRRSMARSLPGPGALRARHGEARAARGDEVDTRSRRAWERGRWQEKDRTAPRAHIDVAPLSSADVLGSKLG